MRKIQVKKAYDSTCTRIYASSILVWTALLHTLMKIVSGPRLAFNATTTGTLISH